MLQHIHSFFISQHFLPSPYIFLVRSVYDIMVTADHSYNPWNCFAVYAKIVRR